MKKMLALLLLSSTACFAMESDVTNNNDDDSVSPLKTIKGVLVIDPNEDTLMYSPYLHKDIQRKLDLEIKETDPVVFVRVLHGDGSSKMLIYLYDRDSNSKDNEEESDDEGLSEFPQKLPLSVLRGKKEGDVLIVTSCRTTQIELTCKQKLVTPTADFERSLQYLIKKFEKKPTCHSFDEKELIEKGIITKITRPKKHGKEESDDEETEEVYQHGPNGYKFGQE